MGKHDDKSDDEVLDEYQSAKAEVERRDSQYGEFYDKHDHKDYVDEAQEEATELFVEVIDRGLDPNDGN